MHSRSKGGRSLIACRAIGVFIFIAVVATQFGASAQAPRRVAMKSGESVDLGQVFFISNCRSIVIGQPEVEILDGPEEVTLSIRPEMVLPRSYKCAKPIQGGILVATAKDVKDSSQSQLTYRVKYKTKDGNRSLGGVYNVSLFP